jgi:hypothetical protein
MAEDDPQDTATESKGTPEVTPEVIEQEPEKKPTETVDFWKSKAREQEKRAKDNADAAKRLSEIEDAQKSEAEKAAERIAKAESEVATVPQKVAESLRSHLIELHSIESDDAELFLTSNDPEVLVKQANRLLAQRTGQGPKPNPQQGNPSEGRGGTLSAGRELYRQAHTKT